MNQKMKSVIVFTPKVIILILSFLNYLYIRAQIPSSTSGAAPSFGQYDVWYLTPRFYDVLIILAAAIFLLISKHWSYLIGVLLSAYIVSSGLWFFFNRNMTMLEVWRFIGENELNIFLQWEVQFILALIIFCATIFYLIREIIDRNSMKESLS